MDFFTLFSPDGVMLETNVVCIVIALMFLYTFVGGYARDLAVV